MELPARIGKYELQEFLGGGISHVYLARDTLIGRTVAVKILTNAGCQDSGIAKTEGLQMTRAGYVLGTPFYIALVEDGRIVNGDPPGRFRRTAATSAACLPPRSVPIASSLSSSRSRSHTKKK